MGHNPKILESIKWHIFSVKFCFIPAEAIVAKMKVATFCGATGTKLCTIYNLILLVNNVIFIRGISSLIRALIECTRFETLPQCSNVVGAFFFFV